MLLNTQTKEKRTGTKVNYTRQEYTTNIVIDLTYNLDCLLETNINRK